MIERIITMKWTAYFRESTVKNFLGCILWGNLGGGGARANVGMRVRGEGVEVAGVVEVVGGG